MTALGPHDHPNLMAAPTKLPDDPAVAMLASGDDPLVVAATYPASSAAWGALAENALAAGHTVEAYAYARTGYHRGLDLLRRNGWKGSGPIPVVARAESGLPAVAAGAGFGQQRDQRNRRGRADRRVPARLRPQPWH